MTDYEIEKQIRQMLDKYQQSDFTKSEVRRCLAEVFSRRLKDYFLKKPKKFDPIPQVRYIPS